MNDAHNSSFLDHIDGCETDYLAPGTPITESGVNDNDKLKILYVLHHWGGGTEKHTLDLTRIVNRDCIVYIMKPFPEGYMVERWENDVKGTFTFISDFKWDISVTHSSEYSNIFEKIINVLEIDVIHIQHLIGNTFDIFDLAKKYRIPVVLTLHDYYAICPRIHPIDARCFGDNGKCISCMCSMGLEDNFVMKWRANFELAVSLADLIIAPDRSVFDIIKNFFKLDNDKLRVIEHGYDGDTAAFGKNRKIKDIAGESEINIAFIGNLLPHKGEKIFYELSTLSYTKKANWFLMGEPGNLEEAKRSDVILIGKFKDSMQLMDLLKENNIHLSLLPAIWPETFSYTLTESWIAGIPAIVSDLGAPSYRVLSARAGWVASPDVQSFKNKIDEVIANPREYIDVQKNILDLKIPTLEESGQVYLKIYAELKSIGPNALSKGQAFNLKDEYIKLSEKHIDDLSLFEKEKCKFDEERSLYEQERSRYEQERSKYEQEIYRYEQENMVLWDQIRILTDQVQNLGIKLVDKENNIVEYNDKMSQLEREIELSNIRYNALLTEIEEMRKSITFKLAARFHSDVIERGLPQNTRRRIFYNSALDISRDLVTEGIRPLIWRVSMRKGKKDR